MPTSRATQGDAFTQRYFARLRAADTLSGGLSMEKSRHVNQAGYAHHQFFSSVNPEFNILHQLLKKRLAIIADHGFRDRDPAAHLEALKQVSEDLMTEHHQLKPILPSRLNHFLSQSSLTKALDFLEGRGEGH